MWKQEKEERLDWEASFDLEMIQPFPVTPVSRPIVFLQSF
jgi:hypothetical protein